MFYVYAIKNEHDKIYIGYTENLEERIKRHNGLLKNKLKSFTSKNKGFWQLIHKEEFAARKDATDRERQLKSCQGRRFIKSLIK